MRWSRGRKIPSDRSALSVCHIRFKAKKLTLCIVSVCATYAIDLCNRPMPWSTILRESSHNDTSISKAGWMDIGRPRHICWTTGPMLFADRKLPNVLLEILSTLPAYTEEFPMPHTTNINLYKMNTYSTIHTKKTHRKKYSKFIL